jgi:cell wall assembly regulator SMI1
MGLFNFWKKNTENRFLNTNQAITLEEVEEFETSFNITLPQAYKEHLLKHNGGYPEKALLNASDFDTSIASFYSLKYGNNTLEDTINTWQIIENVLPKHLLPFADDPGGNAFCISLANEDYGKIYIWYHDVGGRQVYLVDSFEQFMQALKEE